MDALRYMPLRAWMTLDCCFADYLITDLPDYVARWGGGFPTVFRDRRKLGRPALDSIVVAGA